MTVINFLFATENKLENPIYNNIMLFYKQKKFLTDKQQEFIINDVFQKTNTKLTKNKFKK